MEVLSYFETELSLLRAGILSKQHVEVPAWA